MICPSCAGTKLVPSFLEDLFRAHTCMDCGGNWLLIEDYVSWQDRNPDHSFSADASLEAEESKQALICPVTGSVMQKFRISYDSDHYLDYSPAIGGVWLDKGEWDYLKAQKLAGSLSRIFTAQWQKSIRDSNARLTFADIYRQKFGDEDYARAREVRQWLNEHPHGADLRAYLMAADPYSSDK